jgi:hypothetical protein
MHIRYFQAQHNRMNWTQLMCVNIQRRDDVKNFKQT